MIGPTEQAVIQHVTNMVQANPEHHSQQCWHCNTVHCWFGWAELLLQGQDPTKTIKGNSCDIEFVNARCGFSDIVSEGWSAHNNSLSDLISYTRAATAEIVDPTLLKIVQRLIVSIRTDLSQEHIHQLAEDPDWRVRKSIAGRPDLSEALVGYLSQDDEPEVRREIADHLNLSTNLVTILAQDCECMVRCAIASRDDISDVLVQMLVQDKDYPVRREIAKRENLSTALVRHLAHDQSWLVRKAIAYRAELPDELIVLLQVDPEHRVRQVFKVKEGMAAADCLISST